MQCIPSKYMMTQIVLFGLKNLNNIIFTFPHVFICRPGECLSNSDCISWAPYCSKHGYCQTSDIFGNTPDSLTNTPELDIKKISHHQDIEVIQYGKISLVKLSNCLINSGIINFKD